MIYPLILAFVAATFMRVVPDWLLSASLGMVVWQWVTGDLYVWNYQKAINRREKYGGPPRNLFAFDTDAVELTFGIVMFAIFMWISSWFFGRASMFGL